MTTEIKENNQEEINELDEGVETESSDELDADDSEDLDFEDDSEDDSEDDEADDDDQEDSEDDEQDDSEDDEDLDESAGDAADKKTVTDEAAQDKTADQGEEKQTFATLEDEIKSRVKPDYIPGTKEFFAAIEDEAKKAIEAEFGEFDEFDTKHIARFNYFVNESINSRKAEYQAAVKIIANEHQGRRAIQDINSQMDKLLPKPEHKKQLAEALNKISHAAYLEIEESLAKGDPSKLLDLAKKVAGTHGKLLDGKTPEGKKPVKTQQDKKKGEVFGSDILGF